MSDPTPPSAPTPPTPQESGELLDHLLTSLFDDFQYWFERGLSLLDRTPAAILPASEQQDLRLALAEALRALAATRALRAACPTPVAVGLEAMAPWHQLMMRVWNLSALLRVAGIVPPEEGRPDPQAD